jgi:hypothetical protein
MEMPEYVLEIAKEEALRHSETKPAARQVLARLRRRPGFDELRDTLLMHAVEHVVSEARHQHSVKLRKDAGVYGQPSALVQAMANSPSVRAVNSSLYTYFIGGSILGLLTGEQLTPLADALQAQADGVLFNVRLLRRLATVVHGHQTVQAVVSPRRLRAMFTELGGNPEAGAA